MCWELAKRPVALPERFRTGIDSPPFSHLFGDIFQFVLFIIRTIRSKVEVTHEVIRQYIIGNANMLSHVKAEFLTPEPKIYNIENLRQKLHPR